MRALIITAKFGMGHISAAAAIKEELDDSNFTVEIVDIVEYLFPNLSGIIYRGFNIMAARCSHLYNALNKVDQKVTFVPLKGWFIRRFERLINREKPDLIISTWPVAPKYISSYKKTTKYEIPYVTCITDVSAHSEWISDGTSAYIVSDSMVKQKLEAKGVDNNAIYVGGIPVRKMFKTAERSEGSKGEVLIMGGGLGLIPGINNILSYIDSKEGMHGTVITGNNRKLYKRIYGKYNHIDVLGYVDDPARYMRQSDFIISKAGGITLFESINLETPMLVIEPFLEQEKENSGFIENMGIGRVYRHKKEDWGEAISEMLDAKGGLESMRTNMRKIKAEINGNGITKIVKDMELA